MMIFCTLFNSRYLDKGLALLQSLKETTDDFRLYVVAFDDKCYEILSQYADASLKVVSLEEFEIPELLEAKGNRTAQEYCWTCSCHTIKYVLEVCGESQCTYIDADMYFYQDPKVLMDEIEKSGCDVSIIEHGFIPNKENTRYIEASGRYCIEFNTFYATENGRKILNWWCEQCLECCTAKADGIHFGDQKYLDDWLERFEGVYVLKNLGAGVAPWNLARYKYIRKSGRDIQLKEKSTGKKFPVVFYHYQQIKYYTEDLVDIGMYLYPHNVSLELRDCIYKDYFEILKKYRKVLKEKHGFDMAAEQNYAESFSYSNFFRTILKFERDPVIALQRVWRAVFRKKRDIMRIG